MEKYMRRVLCVVVLGIACALAGCMNEDGREGSDMTPEKALQLAPEKAKEMLRARGLASGRRTFREQLQAGDPVVVALYMAAGTDINAGDPESGGYPLATAAVMGEKNRAVIEFLLAQGAKVNVPPGSSSTPLWGAVTSDDVEIVPLMLDHGAEVDAPVGEQGRTPLMLAAKRRDRDIVELLLDRGADVWKKDTGGWMANRLVYSGLGGSTPPPECRALKDFIEAEMSEAVKAGKGPK